MAERRGAVCGARIQHAAVVRVDVVLGRAVQQYVEVRADVQMRQLQRAGQRKDKWYVLHLERLLAHRLDVRPWPRGQATRQRRVRMNVELEQMEEWVRNHRDRAVELRLDAIVELEGLARFVTGWEGNPLELVVCKLNVFASFSVKLRVSGVCLGVVRMSFLWRLRLVHGCSEAFRLDR